MYCICYRLPASNTAKDQVVGFAEVMSFSNDVGDFSLTGQVGTALYVAPELTTSGSKAIYNQVNISFN